MTNIKDLSLKINSHEFNVVCTNLYGANEKDNSEARERFGILIKNYTDAFGENDVELFSTPGRTEIGGNHTDHNHGKVLAGSINLDTVALAGKTDNFKISVVSKGYKDKFMVDLNELSVQESEKGTTVSLIKGIAARFKELGYNVGGFEAAVSSDVLVGSGLSSSAAFEVQIGTILNYFYNEKKISGIEIAKIGQYAENVYFGKPCGLMDQVACALGGIVSIDFNDPGNPVVEKIDYNFLSSGYSLIVVDTGGSHSDLTDDYAAIPAEMKLISGYFDKTVAREINPDEFFNSLPLMRKVLSERAILRVFHFILENERVGNQVNFLKQHDFRNFLKLVNESGNSSFKYLQNIFSVKDVNNQSVSLALAISEKYIREINEGACRVHGGGFAGTIQVFLPNDRVQEYSELIERIFGSNSALKLFIRQQGSIRIEI